MQFITAFVVLLFAAFCAAQEENSFHNAEGCRYQYNSYQGYSFPHPSFSIANFRNVRRNSDGVVVIRLGLVGKSDGHVRLSPVPVSNRAVYLEIVLGGWDNTKSVVRECVRYNAREITEQISERSTPGLMREFKPTMFTIEIHPNGDSYVQQDGVEAPIMRFTNRIGPANFISFSNWYVPVLALFDCPLRD